MSDMTDEMLDYCDDDGQRTFHEVAFTSILAETFKAWLIRFPMDKKLISQECWLPKSQCEPPDLKEKTIQIPQWLVNEKELWDHVV